MVELVLEVVVKEIEHLSRASCAILFSTKFPPFSARSAIASTWLWGHDGCQNYQVLGDEQWKWLENELMSSSSSDDGSRNDSELFLIASHEKNIPMVSVGGMRVCVFGCTGGTSRSTTRF